MEELRPRNQLTFYFILTLCTGRIGVRGGAEARAMRLKLKTCVLSSVVWLALCFLLILYSFWPQEEKVVRQSMIITVSDNNNN